MASLLQESEDGDILFFNGAKFDVIDEHGEIVGQSDLDDVSLEFETPEEARAFIDKITIRRREAIAEAEGLRKQKQVMQEALDRSYDPRIRRASARADYIDATFTSICEKYAREVIGEERLHAKVRPVRSLKLDFATLQFNKTRASVDIDESLASEDSLEEVTPVAVPFFSEHCPEAVRCTIKMPLSAIKGTDLEKPLMIALGFHDDATMERDIMKSKIPQDVKEAINEPWFDYNPGGEDTFKIV